MPASSERTSKQPLRPRRPMTEVVSVSLDDPLAAEMDGAVADLGYHNRSRLVRDALRSFLAARANEVAFADRPEQEVEGVLVVYYQHEVERRLIDLRHAEGIDVHSWNHTCLSDSHQCVDTLLVKGRADLLAQHIERFQATEGVDEARFLAAPKRDMGCC